MRAIHKRIANFFADKKIALLGFGKEGQSSLKFIRKYHPKLPVVILDERKDKPKGLNLDRWTIFIEGAKFKKIKKDDFDLVLSSPGIPPKKLPAALLKSDKLYGQAELFLQWFGWQTIGVTGTKGKSTSSSLTYHLLKKAGVKVFLGGNIGVPLFDLIPKLNQKSYVVAELSCHQLNRSKTSPHIGILLNLFEEHLDYYKSKEDYFASKLSIFKYQQDGDTLIYNFDDKRIKKYLKLHKTNQEKMSYSFKTAKANLYVEVQNLYTDMLRGKAFALKTNLLGDINHYNIMPAVAVAATLKISKTEIKKHLATFQPLAHRLQYLGQINNIHFVNDSISTIPEATQAAVKALENVGCLFLGGMDRGVNYIELVKFLKSQKIKNIVFFDKAGKRMYEEYQKMYPKQIEKISYLVTEDFKRAVQFCLDNSPKNSYCLLSPAASSYGIFKNFEDRGSQFSKFVLKLSKHKKFKK